MSFLDLLPPLEENQAYQLNVVSESLDSLFLSRALGEKRALLVVPNLLTAERFYEDFTQLGVEAELLPEKEALRKGIYYSSEELLLERAAVLKAWKSGVLIASVAALAYEVPQREVFQEGLLRFTLDVKIEREELLSRLIELGYERKYATERWGDFSVRGDIVDVFVPGEEHPFRIEFFGDEVDGMRSFDASSQRSIDNLFELEISPAQETNLPKGSYLEDWAEEHFVYDEITCLNRYEGYYKDALLNLEQQEEGVELPREVIRLERLLSKGRIMVDPHHQLPRPGYSYVSVDARRNVDYRGAIADFFSDFHQRQDMKQVLLLPSEESPLIHELKTRGIPYEISPEEVTRGVLAIEYLSLSRGFIYEKKDLVVYTQQEILGGTKRRKRKYFQESSEPISNFLDLKIGDYVVHRHHGIGRYGGVVQKQIEGITRDYLEIAYRGTDVLFIPSDQLQLIQRYVGGDVGKVALSKLGSPEWKRRKERARQSIDDLTEKLLELYAKRETAKGFAFSPDTPWQRQFEMDFPYEETKDQLRAAEEMKQDMESSRPMDRLLLGDVGFGKTEVALRGIFKAVMDSKQAVFLVPTTVLSSQHYDTLKRRFAAYPIKIAQLSRLTPPNEKEEILKGLAKGSIDVVVGTHMVLGDGVKFHDLGLFIIDEEQRFGVADKEKIRELRAEVDTLSLSATPIPRTLHLSLGGIRDMSILREPPRNRYPIQTFIAREDMDVVREAITRELDRGGQIYYIYNRVESMEKVQARLRKYFPDISIAMAHGRMNRNALEETMLAFREGRIDLLLSTTIVETGMDISNVNTMIIENAQNFGLSQLYQLRGRVGRSDRLAYAYLFYPPHKELSQDAHNRLETLREFTDFGSGYKIAMRDLEIRGSGSILGADQSGHFGDIGYELYMEMLREKAQQLRGEQPKHRLRAQIQLPISAYLPSDYIQEEGLKMEMYRKMDGITRREELDDLEDELMDRFGDLPEPVEKLLQISYLSGLAGTLGFKEVTTGRLGLRLFFDETSPPSVEWFTSLHKDPLPGVQVKTGLRPSLILPMKAEDLGELLAFLEKTQEKQYKEEM